MQGKPLLPLVLAAAGVVFSTSAVTAERRAVQPVLPPDQAHDYTQTLPGSDASFRMVALPGVAQLWMSQTEVTWDEYELFYFWGADEEFTPEVKRKVDAVSRPTPPYGAPDQGWGTGRRPALSMTLFAVRKYCEWLSALTGKTYRLPTEAEWRLACKSGRMEGAKLRSIVWYRENTRRMTMETGTLAPNSLGLRDLLGNVEEFVDPDREAGGSPGRRDMPVYGGSYRSRGGELGCVDPRIVSEAGCLMTDPQDPKSKWWYSDCFTIGFRVVRSLP